MLSIGLESCTSPSMMFLLVACLSRRASGSMRLLHFTAIALLAGSAIATPIHPRSVDASLLAITPTSTVIAASGLSTSSSLGTCKAFYFDPKDDVPCGIVARQFALYLSYPEYDQTSNSRWCETFLHSNGICRATSPNSPSAFPTSTPSTLSISTAQVSTTSIESTASTTQLPTTSAETTCSHAVVATVLVEGTIVYDTSTSSSMTTASVTADDVTASSDTLASSSTISDSATADGIIASSDTLTSSSTTVDPSTTTSISAQASTEIATTVGSEASSPDYSVVLASQRASEYSATVIRTSSAARTSSGDVASAIPTAGSSSLASVTSQATASSTGKVFSQAAQTTRFVSYAVGSGNSTSMQTALVTAYVVGTARTTATALKSSVGVLPTSNSTLAVLDTRRRRQASVPALRMSVDTSTMPTSIYLDGLTARAQPTSGSTLSGVQYTSPTRTTDVPSSTYATDDAGAKSSATTPIGFPSNGQGGHAN